MTDKFPQGTFVHLGDLGIRPELSGVGIVSEYINSSTVWAWWQDSKDRTKWHGPLFCSEGMLRRIPDDERDPELLLAYMKALTAGTLKRRDDK